MRNKWKPLWKLETILKIIPILWDSRINIFVNKKKMWMWMKKWIVNGVNKFMSWRNHIFESKCQNREGKIIAQKCLDLKYIDRKVYLCKKWTPLQKLIILILFTFERIDFSEWFNHEGIWFSNANLKRQKSESTYLVCLIIATIFF